MIRSLLSFVVLTILATSLGAYQNTLPSLITPTALYPKESELNLAHRFYGAVSEDVWNTMFGLNSGANVNLAYRYHFAHGVELKAAYTRAQKQAELGAAWHFTPSDFPAQGQLDIAYFSFEQPGMDKRRNNFAYILSGQSDFLIKRLAVSLNAGYDGYYERFFNGYGMHFEITEKMFLVGEFYPVWDRDSAAPALAQYLGKYDTYSAGIKMDTYGHHFMFCISNNPGMSPRIQALGTNNRKPGLGFNIQRRLGA